MDRILKGRVSTNGVQLHDLCLYACVFILVNSYFCSACIMVVHIMCLTTSGGLPLFTRKRGDCDPVSITAASVFTLAVVAYFYFMPFVEVQNTVWVLPSKYLLCGFCV